MLTLWMFLCSLSLSFAFLLLLPAFVRTPPQVERLHAMVRSSRPDRRRIGLRERLSTRLSAAVGRVRSALGMGTNPKLGRRLHQAGIRGAGSGDLFFAAQVLGMLAGVGAGSFLNDNTAFWMIAGAVAGYMIPDMWLTSRGKRRRVRIGRSLPDMVDLLGICVGAGLGLDQALLRVGQELVLSHPEITGELARVTLERKAGAPRVEAWQAMAERIQLEELTSFVTMLAETDRFGTPIVKALEDFSHELREGRRQKAEEAAAKTKIKIIFPLVLCIFPCIFIVLLAPALLSLLKGFDGMGR